MRPPKLLHPSPTRETARPLEPRSTVSMARTLPREAVPEQQVLVSAPDAQELPAAWRHEVGGLDEPVAAARPGIPREQWRDGDEELLHRVGCKERAERVRPGLAKDEAVAARMERVDDGASVEPYLLVEGVNGRRGRKPTLEALGTDRAREHDRPRLEHRVRRVDRAAAGDDRELRRRLCAPPAAQLGERVGR